VKIGVPKEIKTHEYRVGLTPAGVRELAIHGHHVIVERNAAAGIGLSDDIYRAAGAMVVDSAAEVFATADLIVKVKEPQPSEIAMLRQGQVLFTYLHLAADKAQTKGLMDTGATCIAYETVTDRSGALPLLAPMSEVAGRLAAQVGAYHLMKPAGGRGVLMGGVPGVGPADVVVIGGGTAGYNAARVASGMGAHVTVLDLNIGKLRELDAEFGGRILTRYSSGLDLEGAVKRADLVIGAVLVPGAKAPKLVSNSLVSHMKPGAVLVDIAIDQGGCFEDSRPTTHDEPTYRVHDSVFYCVANMPGAVPHTSTYALTNVTLPYITEIANRGWQDALRADPALARGLSTHDGALTCQPVAAAHGLPFTPAAEVLD
jgi:alanine dehydrogenase